MGVENFDKTRGKFLVEIKREIFRFNSLSSGSKQWHNAKSKSPAGDWPWNSGRQR